MKSRLRFRFGELILLIAGVLLVFVASPAAVRTTRAAGVRYAAPAVVGIGDCSSWENACTLQTALTGAVSGDEIWILAGVHTPTTDPADRTASFYLKTGVALYGGFAGTEIHRDQRNWSANPTILSGDIDSNDTNTDGNYINESWEDIQGANTYHVVFGSFLDGTVILDGFTVTGGQSAGSSHGDIGAGILINWCNSNVTYANLVVSGNMSGVEGDTNGSGGGIYHPCGTVAFTNIVFTGNFAGSGGGATIGGEATLNDVLFQENSAVGCGGGMLSYPAESPVFMDVDFYRNSAGSGGGLCNGYWNDTILTNVTFTENHAGGGGGAMYNGGSSNPVLTNVAFSGNSADQNGGGAIFSTGGSSPSLTNVTFSGNSATFGGALFNSSGSPILTNVAFSGNSADFDGGGMWTNNSTPSLTNVTFSGNSAGDEGGGLYNSNTSNQILTNIILWGNTASLGAGIWNDSSTPTIVNSDIQGCGGSGSWNSACGTDGGGNIEADPLFVNPAGGNLRLQLASLAIDSGDNSALSPEIITDLGGSPRFVDIPFVPDTGSGAPPIVDMGAYEAQFMDVALGKAVLPQAAAPGEAITFTLHLTNTGTVDATGIVVTDTLPLFLMDVTITSTLTVTDSGTLPPFVWMVQDLAPGESGGITAGGVLAVPLAAGTYTNTALISAVGDMVAENNTASISFTVPNVAPVFASVPLLTAVQDEVYTYTVSAQDDNGDALAITAPTLPGWLTLMDHGDGTAALSGAPENVDVGAHGVVLKVADTGNLTSTQSFTITVANVNDSPTFTSPPALTATQDVLYSYAVAADDPDLIHGDALTITAPVIPDWLTLVDHGDGTATLAGTPANADVGTHAVVLRATDSGGLFSEQAFAVTAANVNDAPEFTSVPVTTATQYVLYTYVVTADDPDLIHGDALTITAATLPAWLILTDHGDGTATLAGTPTDADVGTHTVELYVADGGALTDAQTFMIVVWARIYLPFTSRGSP